jgi:NAD-dependent deacetylase
MRPDVVWFGEVLPAAALSAAQAAALACDVFLSIGTSNVVEPAASLPWLAAKHGATVIVINPAMDGQRTGPSVLQLAGNAAALVPRLVERAFRGRRPRARRPDGTVVEEEISDEELVEEFDG